jgi:hypothetical protein
MLCGGLVGEAALSLLLDNMDVVKLLWVSITELAHHSRLHF